eukprot:6704144-Lingulodinium_polyedra.AAC.1
MAVVIADIDYESDAFPFDFLVAMAPPVFQQTYVGLCAFFPPLSAPVRARDCRGVREVQAGG